MEQRCHVCKQESVLFGFTSSTGKRLQEREGLRENETHAQQEGTSSYRNSIERVRNEIHKHAASLSATAKKKKTQGSATIHDG